MSTGEGETAGGGGDGIEVRFRLFDGSDIGPSRHDPATAVTALKEFILARWPQDKEIIPKTVNEITIINSGRILENNRTLGDSRVPAAEAPGGVITMHVVVRPQRADKSEKRPSKAPSPTGQNSNRCGCTIL
ncbi:membrane-anchored ubiquitin-fold protein 3-like [Oryza brachyantha]|uniref:Membrane-anchored ubiquitin-fold protein n=1 Tax=Oryza brachyantha TaxID=4533 RepID=J3MCK5_ORYBR|nr:membrane-anchored ubiquitin-fold protein 3-like [Oryza brachyantha]